MSEFDFIRDLRPLTDLDPALGLADDAALVPAQAEVVCTDTLVEAVHFLGSEPAGDLAHKLLAVDGQSQSGHPSSPHYSDQYSDWLDGNYHEISLEPNSDAAASWTLEPDAG